ncbi:hypothetical protein E5D57_012722 [Metarhizium anisopliae]|nr:hypothetical protein E5D57_012722 [Metarhizium anisopliae]
MPAPKRVLAEKPSSRRAPKGFLVSAYGTLTSSENAAVVRSIAMFGVSLAWESLSIKITLESDTC